MKGEAAESSDYYECSMTPKNAAEECKTGITFKGNDEEYVNAQKKVLQMIKKKGERYEINGIEVAIVDTPKNKPVLVKTKSKTGLSGKSNLKVYDVNAKGGATIMVSKVSGSDIVHAKNLAFKVVKYLLDSLISGDIDDESIEI